MTPLGTTTAYGGADSTAAPSPSPARPPVRPRLPLPKPQRSPELSHMTLDRLRAYRRTLLAEELRTSYWRRILQARRDVLRSGNVLDDRERLLDVLTEARTAGRQAILSLHPQGGMPILPTLPELWATGTSLQSAEAEAELFTKLASAESVLSSYREALHRRLDRATADLVARYHEEPRSCFVALPI